MPAVTTLPGSYLQALNDYIDNNLIINDHDYSTVIQHLKAQGYLKAQNLVDKTVNETNLNTEFIKSTDKIDLEEPTGVVSIQEPEQQDESGQQRSSNQSSRTQASKQNNDSRDNKGYESGSSEADDEQTNDDGDDDDDDENGNRRRNPNTQDYEASDETSYEEDDEEDEDDEEEEEVEPTPPPPPPSSRKRKMRADEESRRDKNVKRRRAQRQDETDDESGPIEKRSQPEKKIIHEYYREIGRSGKHEFRMEDHFNNREIRVIHNFLSEISRMRGQDRQITSQKREGNGRRTSSKQKSRSRQGRLERKHSDIYESFSKPDQQLIHDYYRQIGHKGGKYRGTEVDEEELDEEDRKVHPGFLKEKRKRQQNVVHDFLSKVAKEKRWGQAPSDKTKQKRQGAANKMRSSGREM